MAVTEIHIKNTNTLVNDTRILPNILKIEQYMY
jgi:hypothetical protein